MATDVPVAGVNEGPVLAYGSLIFPLWRCATLLGRADPSAGTGPDVDLSPLGLGMAASRRHAEIEYRGASFVVRDLGSRLGTSVNGEPLPPGDPRTIAEGDTVSIGTVTFELRTAPWPPGLSAEWSEEPTGPGTVVTSFGGALIAAQLPAALAGDQLSLYYQPQIDFSSRRIRSVEALMRWIHPSEGMVAPDRFIPAAETTGFVRRLTDFAVRSAAAQAAAWRGAGKPVAVSVNVSARDLEDDGFVDRAIGGVEEAGGSPQDLLFEITESRVVSDPERAIEAIGALKDAGFGVGIDDFGAGESSLGYLSRLPVDEVKLDRVFAMDLGDRNASIVRAAIALGHDLGLEVVAEGVETEGTAERLLGLGCDKGQGWFYGRPVPPNEISL